MKRATVLAASVAMLLAASVTRSDAAVLTFTDLASWSGAVGAYNTETFNSFVADTSFQGVSVALADGMSVIGTTGANVGVTQKIDTPPLEFGAFYDIDGTAQLLGDLAGPNQYTRFDFATPMTAWSMETKGIADTVLRPTTLTIYDASNAVLGSILMSSDASNQQLQFYGFQLTGGDVAAYLTLTNAEASNDVFGIDNVRYVTAVPEPATLALLGLGFAAVARRRRA